MAVRLRPFLLVAHLQSLVLPTPVPSPIAPQHPHQRRAREMIHVERVHLLL